MGCLRVVARFIALVLFTIILLVLIGLYWGYKNLLETEPAVKEKKELTLIESKALKAKIFIVEKLISEGKKEDVSIRLTDDELSYLFNHTKAMEKNKARAHFEFDKQNFSFLFTQEVTKKRFANLKIKGKAYAQNGDVEISLDDIYIARKKIPKSLNGQLATVLELLLERKGIPLDSKKNVKIMELKLNKNQVELRAIIKPMERGEKTEGSESQSML